MLAFAFLATVINYLDRQTLSVMAPVLLAQFHISAETYSQIISAFMLAYTLMNGISGRLLDRLGSKVGYGLTIAWWSGAEILHAFSGGAFSLGIFRFLLGFGEAGNYPAGVKVIAEWFPAEERSLASGIFNSGAAIGAILAPPLLAWIALSLGWRSAFVVIGLLGFVWLAVWMAFYRDPETAMERTVQIPLKVLLKSRFLWQFTLSKVFSDPVWYFYTFWFPQYLKSVHGFSLLQIGETAWIPFFAAALGNLAGGAVFAALLPLGKGVARTRRLAILIFSMLMISAVLVQETRRTRRSASPWYQSPLLAIRAHLQTCSQFQETCFQKGQLPPYGVSPAWVQASGRWSLAWSRGGLWSGTHSNQCLHSSASSR